MECKKFQTSLKGRKTNNTLNDFKGQRTTLSCGKKTY